MVVKHYGRNNPIPTLGALIRSAREECGLDPEALGEPGLTANFVVALERGRVRPSPVALRLLVERLGIPYETLQSARRTRLVKPNLHAYEQDLTYQLDLANAMLHNNDLEVALEIIALAKSHAARYLRFMSTRVTFRIPYLRGKAYNFARRPADAQREFERALRILDRSAGSPAAANINARQEETATLAQIHNMLGVCYFMQGRLRKAQEQHLLCLKIIATSKLKKPSFTLSIYRNLANDYWASGHHKLAIGEYKKALEVLADVHDPQRQAGVHWGLSMVYKDMDDLTLAMLHAKQAFDLYSEAKALGMAATMGINLAEMMIADARYDVAEEHLSKARDWLEAPTLSPSQEESGAVQVERHDLLLCTLYATYARLAWKRNDLIRAGEYANRSLEYGERLVLNTKEADEAEGYPARSFAEALTVAAQVHEALGKPDVADRFFERSLAVIATTEFNESYKAIAFEYAVVREARRDFQGAAELYRLAASKSGLARR